MPRAIHSLLIALTAASLAGAESDRRPNSPPPGGDAKPAAQVAGARRVGRIIKISLPITGVGADQVRRAVLRVQSATEASNDRLVLIFELDVPRDQQENSTQSKFGSAYELAEFISGPQLAGVQTIAYVPKSVRGHAVLVAIACESIVMAEDAQIGDAGAAEAQIDPTELAGYAEIAKRKQTVPPELAMGLLDRSREVLQVKTDREHMYLSPEGLAKEKKSKTIQEVRTLKAAGQVALFTGAEWRRLGFVERLVANRAEVARAFGLPPEAVQEELAAEWRASRIDVHGNLSGDAINKIEQLITNETRQRQTNFICLWVESPGGSPADSLRLAGLLASPELSRVRTVAYVPKEARSDAALIALACDQLVVGPRAVLGGSGSYPFSEAEIRETTKVLRDVFSKKKLRSWSLPAAMIDPSLEVYRYTRLGVTEFLSEPEAAEQPVADKWEKGAAVTIRGQPFQAVGQQAVDYRLANAMVEDFHQLKAHYGLQDDPTLLEPGWAEFLIEALATPSLAVLLLIVGFAALYAELHTLGLGIGGFIAAACFALFFWSRYLGGTAGWLEVMLFLMGLAFLALEIFVIPGFGIFGLGGGAMMLASLVLASQTFVIPRNAYQFAQMEQSLWTIAGAAVGVIVLATLLRRWLPRAPILGSILLEPPSGAEAATIRRREALLNAQDLIGAHGTTTTQLVPGGKARFGNRILDVVTEGELIARGIEVVVIEVRGSRIVVQPLS